uniref:Uncharacterized protein n=1 Tax=Rhabditophanes sp. KR3021 TaxID=114890 RepID=A0AC35TX27_9BILA
MRKPNKYYIFLINSLLYTILLILLSVPYSADAYYVLPYGNEEIPYQQSVTPSGIDNNIISMPDNKGQKSPKIMEFVRIVQENGQPPMMPRELIELIDKEAMSAAEYLDRLGRLKKSLAKDSANSNRDKQKRMLLNYEEQKGPGAFDEYGFPTNNNYFDDLYNQKKSYKKRAIWEDVEEEHPLLW